MMIENIWYLLSSRNTPGQVTKHLSIRGMLHDRTAYPDPDIFDPERWLGFDRKHVHHPLNIVFGYGRR